MKIEHIVSDPHSPQTLGKVERLNQTVQRGGDNLPGPKFNSRVENGKKGEKIGGKRGVLDNTF